MLDYIGTKHFDYLVHLRFWFYNKGREVKIFFKLYIWVQEIPFNYLQSKSFSKDLFIRTGSLFYDGS